MLALPFGQDAKMGVVRTSSPKGARRCQQERQQRDEGAEHETGRRSEGGLERSSRQFLRKTEFVSDVSCQRITGHQVSAT